MGWVGLGLGERWTEQGEKNRRDQPKRECQCQVEAKERRHKTRPKKKGAKRERTKGRYEDEEETAINYKRLKIRRKEEAKERESALFFLNFGRRSTVPSIPYRVPR